jgi:hypothetical protein
MLECLRNVFNRTAIELTEISDGMLYCNVFALYDDILLRNEA